MKKALSCVVIAFIAFLLLPVHIQLAQEVKPVEEPDKKVDAKKYDLKIEYKKGMEFDRTINIKMKGESSNEPEDDFDGDLLLKLKVLIIDEKDGKPIQFRLHFLDSAMKGAFPGDDEEEPDFFAKYKGSWIEYKKNSEGDFELLKTSENYPKEEEDEDELITDDEMQNMIFDIFELPSKAISIGEEFKFDYTKLLLHQEISGAIDQMLKMDGKDVESKLKFEKLIEKDGNKIALLTSEITKNVNMFGMIIDLKMNINISLDITNNRCLSAGLKVSFEMNGSNPDNGEKLEASANFDFNFLNKYTDKESESKPEVTPKEDE